MYRYEELLADLVGMHKLMTDFLRLDIPRKYLEEAVSLITKEKNAGEIQRRRIGTAAQGFISRQERENSGKRKQMILDRLDQKLVYNFGYEFAFSD